MPVFSSAYPQAAVRSASEDRAKGRRISIRVDGMNGRAMVE
jgi:hypothetical protein